MANPPSDAVQAASDRQFMSRLFGHAGQSSNAADRQQRDIVRRNPERSRGEGMAKLVRYHAGKDCRDQQCRIESSAQSTGNSTSRRPAAATR